MEVLILPLILLTSLVALAVGAAIYIFSAFGLYRMAQNLGLPSPWMAFVPVASSYLLGLIAEKDSMGKRTLKYSWILLITQIVSFFFSTGYYFALLAFRLTGSFLMAVMFFLAYGMLSIVACIFYYIALYRVYKLYDPDNAPIFIILSILFSISVPILMFVLRNRQPIINYGSPFDQTNYTE